MKRTLPSLFLLVVLLTSPLATWSQERLIERLDHRFTCWKGKAQLQVRVSGRDWGYVANQCGNEKCRAEPSCSSAEGRERIEGRAKFDRLALDLACYNGKLYTRYIDQTGAFKLQIYEGNAGFACDPKDNGQFTATYFAGPDATPAAPSAAPPAARATASPPSVAAHFEKLQADLLEQATSGRNGAEREVIVKALPALLAGRCLPSTSGERYETVFSDCKEAVARAYRQPQTKEDRANDTTGWHVLISFLGKPRRTWGDPPKWNLNALCGRWEQSPDGYKGSGLQQLFMNGTLTCGGIDYNAETLVPRK